MSFSQPVTSTLPSTYQPDEFSDSDTHTHTESVSQSATQNSRIVLHLQHLPFVSRFLFLVQSKRSVRSIRTKTASFVLGLFEL